MFAMSSNIHQKRPELIYSRYSGNFPFGQRLDEGNDSVGRDEQFYQGLSRINFVADDFTQNENWT
jgi:hypothetical protein